MLTTGRGSTNLCSHENTIFCPTMKIGIHKISWFFVVIIKPRNTVTRYNKRSYEKEQKLQIQMSTNIPSIWLSIQQYDANTEQK